ncbi:hypothetical protein U4I66_07810 [Stenotrophomonas maltophilia]|uniref:hypothetical protein n=1 Tax=Stenotrophomonas maltophilia TaxID=40324 RepID=UPI002ACCC4E0|nr:hypothetical protein [Stenotrophomonas maltophilia]MDZ5841742.1 hypothetical protein [Stenotrophomonas maltophilia]
MAVLRNIPNPAEILPAEGVTQVLVRAAEVHPAFALLLVALIICFTVAAVCWLLERRKFYAVLASSEAANALIQIKKIDNEHKKNMAKMKQQQKKKKQELPQPAVASPEAG